MKYMLVVFLACAILLPHSTHADADDDEEVTLVPAFVSSNDELKLTYAPQGSTAQLYGEPGTSHRVVLNLQNQGPKDKFKITQTSSHALFVGQYDDIVEVRSGGVQTIAIKNLMVPASNIEDNSVDITVTAKRVGMAMTAKMKEVSTQLLFRVESDPYSSDTESPEVERTHSGECPQESVNSTQRCSMYSWHAEFKIKDEGSGIRSVEVEAAGVAGNGISIGQLTEPVKYEHRNFPIGERDDVELTSDVSCCITGITVRAVDMAGNEAAVEFNQGDGAATAAASLFGIIATAILALKTN